MKNSNPQSTITPTLFFLHRILLVTAVLLTPTLALKAADLHIDSNPKNEQMPKDNLNNKKTSEPEIRKNIGETTGGKNYIKKRYKTTKIKGKKVQIIPPEDILMQTEVPTPQAPKEVGTSIRVSLPHQRAWLYENGKPVLVSSITPGKKSSPTPKGKYHIINKHRHWTSTIYNVPMPYFLRLNPGYFGLHQGKMKVTPASHGCIRLPEKEASEFFALAKVGDPVWIE